MKPFGINLSAMAVSTESRNSYLLPPYVAIEYKHEILDISLMSNTAFQMSANVLTSLEVQEIDFSTKQYYFLCKIIETCLKLNTLKISAVALPKKVPKKRLKDRLKLTGRNQRKKLFTRYVERELWNIKYINLLSIRQNIKIVSTNYFHSGIDKSKIKRNLCACLVKQRKMNILNLYHFYEATYGYLAMKMMNQMIMWQKKTKRVNLLRKTLDGSKKSTFFESLVYNDNI